MVFQLNFEANSKENDLVMFHSIPSRNYQAADKITPREKEVYLLISLGLSSKEIASRMYLSIETIRTHRKKLMQKIGARNMAMLVRRGFEMGIIS